ncbi:MAG: EAL domain-containing protein, partial [Rhodothermales bacterium]|nr:EAL domain-containing protein [Rhodothermales bacterium]
MDHLSDEEISKLVPPQFGTRSVAETCTRRAVLEVDQDNLITHLDETLAGILSVAHPSSDVIGLTIDAFADAVEQSTDAFEKFISLVIRHCAHDKNESTELAVEDSRVLNVEYVPLRVGEAIVRRMWLVRDDTARIVELERIRFQAAVLSQVSDAVLTVDANMAISYWNKGAEELTGQKASEVIGLGPEEVFQFRFPSPGDEHTAWKALGEGGAWSGELIINTSNSDRERYVATNAKILRDDAGDFTGLLAVVRDETERREMEDKLIHHAYHDLLTGLPNRMMLLRTLDGLTSNIENIEPTYALLFLDLDRFKMVNDSLGHHAGDAMLKTLAVRLKDCIRGHDIVARLGGDEFAILLTEVEGTEGATEVADRIMASMEEPFIIEGMEIFTAASIGIVFGDVHYDLAEDILRDADTAMYQAKRAGRSCYAVFDQTQQMHASAMFQLETDLRRAIERDELRVHYQPIVDIQRGTLTGFEALLRWHHSHRGLIAPGQFLPVAEETGLIVDLDRWLWRTAVLQLADWRTRFGEELGLTISVNCSNRSFHRPDMNNYIKDILDEAGLPASAFTMEVTEGVVIDDTETAVKELESLREMGIRVSLDDFGTGYASLSVLHSLPIDLLKIDRSFVKRMDRRADGTQLIQTVIEMGQTLGMKCVAEGIEIRRQLEQLQEMNCVYGQGYLFSKPLDADLTGALIGRR